MTRQEQIGRIQALTAAAFGLESAALTGRDRRQEISTARQAAMFIAVRACLFTHAEVGRCFDGREQSSVYNAVRSFDVALIRYPALTQTVKSLLDDVEKSCPVYQPIKKYIDRRIIT